MDGRSKSGRVEQGLNVFQTGYFGSMLHQVTDLGIIWQHRRYFSVALFFCSDIFLMLWEKLVDFYEIKTGDINAATNFLIMFSYIQEYSGFWPKVTAEYYKEYVKVSISFPSLLLLLKYIFTIGPNRFWKSLSRISGFNQTSPNFEYCSFHIKVGVRQININQLRSEGSYFLFITISGRNHLMY